MQKGKRYLKIIVLIILNPDYFVLMHRVECSYTTTSQITFVKPNDE